MPSETTYSSLRENLATVLDQVVDQQDTVIVRRRGARDVALIPASELAGLTETAVIAINPIAPAPIANLETMVCSLFG